MEMVLVVGSGYYNKTEPFSVTGLFSVQAVKYSTAIAHVVLVLWTHLLEIRGVAAQLHVHGCCTAPRAVPALAMANAAVQSATIATTAAFVPLNKGGAQGGFPSHHPLHYLEKQYWVC